jgi:hypothetical protein
MKKELYQILMRHNFDSNQFLQDNHSIPQELMRELKQFYVPELGCNMPLRTPEQRFNTDYDSRDLQYEEDIHNRLKHDLRHKQ